MPKSKKPLSPNINCHIVMKKIEGAKRKAMSIFVIQAKSVATRNMTKVMEINSTIFPYHRVAQSQQSNRF
jgi:hypothetical protein